MGWGGGEVPRDAGPYIYIYIYTCPGSQHYFKSSGSFLDDGGSYMFVNQPIKNGGWTSRVCISCKLRNGFKEVECFGVCSNLP